MTNFCKESGGPGGRYHNLRIDWTFYSLGGFCPGGILARGDFVRGDFVRGDFGWGGFCPRGILSGGILSGGILTGGILSGGILSCHHCGYIRVPTQIAFQIPCFFTSPTANFHSADLRDL